MTPVTQTISQLYSIADSSASDFQVTSELQQAVDTLYANVKDLTLQIPSSEKQKCSRKLAIIEDRISESTQVADLIRTALLDKLNTIQDSILGKKLHEAVGLVDPKESFVLNLWARKFLRIDAASGELLISNQLAKQMTDAVLDEILAYSSSANKAKIRYINIAQYPNLSLLAPSIVVRHFPKISLRSFACMTSHPERFCNHSLRVEEKAIPVNKEFLAEISAFFRTQFASTMRANQGAADETVVTTMAYGPLQDCIKFLGGDPVPQRGDLSLLEKYVSIASVTLIPQLFDLLEPAFLSILTSDLAEQEDAFVVLNSLYDQVERALDAGAFVTVFDKLDELFETAASVKTDRIYAAMPQKDKRSYLVRAVATFPLSLIPYPNLNIYNADYILAITLSIQRSYYIPPSEIIPILEDQVKIFSEDCILRTLLAIQYLRRGEVSDWNQAKQILLSLVKNPDQLGNFSCPYIAFADMLRMGTPDVPPNPQAAKKIASRGLSRFPAHEGLHMLFAQILFKDEDLLEDAIDYALAHTSACKFFIGYLRSHLPDFGRSQRYHMDLYPHHINQNPALFEDIARLGCFFKMFPNGYSGELGATWGLTKAFGKGVIVAKETRLFYSLVRDILEEMPDYVQLRVTSTIEDFETAS